MDFDTGLLINNLVDIAQWYLIFRLVKRANVTSRLSSANGEAFLVLLAKEREREENEKAKRNTSNN